MLAEVDAGQEVRNVSVLNHMVSSLLDQAGYKIECSMQQEVI